MILNRIHIHEHKLLNSYSWIIISECKIDWWKIWLRTHFIILNQIHVKLKHHFELTKTSQNRLARIHNWRTHFKRNKNY